MKTLPRMGTLALLLAACDPLVDLDLDDTSGATSTGSADGGGVSGGPGSVPPNPTTPVTTSPVTTSPGTGGGCTPGTFETCVCPSGYQGAQECGPSGTYLPCECDDYESSTSGWDSWGSSGWGSSTGWWGSSSSGGWDDNHIPDLPPGETCLPIDLPCEGFFEVVSDAGLEQLSTCSRIAGDLLMYGEDVTSLEPLGCLRQVDGGVVVDHTQVTTLDGFGLENAELVAIVQNSQLILFEAPVLYTLDALYIFGNANLDTVALPQLATLQTLDVQDNEMLPDCTVVELFEQTSPNAFNCEANLDDKCTPMCG